MTCCTRKPKLIKLFDLNPTFGVDYLRNFHFCQTICVRSTALVLSLSHTKLFIFYHSIYVVLITDVEMNCVFVNGIFIHYNKKAFQSKANRPLANRCLGYMVNEFEQDHVVGARSGAPMWPEQGELRIPKSTSWKRSTCGDPQNVDRQNNRQTSMKTLHSWDPCNISDTQPFLVHTWVVQYIISCKWECYTVIYVLLFFVSFH